MSNYAQSWLVLRQDIEECQKKGGCELSAPHYIHPPRRELQGVVVGSHSLPYPLWFEGFCKGFVHKIVLIGFLDEFLNYAVFVNERVIVGGVEVIYIYALLKAS